MASTSVIKAARDIPFEAIGKKAFQFLRDLKAHNDRDWFRERKHIFEEELKQPLEALLRDSAALIRKSGFALYPKEKNPTTRIYRDIRFRADKTPFNTHLGGSLRGLGAKAGLGEVYVHVTFGEPFVAAGYWMPERPFLQAWRERMAGDTAEYIKLLKQLSRNGMQWLDEYSLKRLPKGFESQAGAPLEKEFKRQVYIVHQPLTERDFSSPEAVKTIARFALAAKPLIEYGWGLKYSPKRDILDNEMF
jgi:uncharacterized protein (TIGR02453 family)